MMPSRTMATARELGPADWKRYRGPAPPAPPTPTAVEETKRRLERVSQAAEHLKRLGARRVVLFGSLARDGESAHTRDVDLAVLGLPAHLFWKAGCAAEEIIADRPVDLIPLEEAGEALLAEIERDGVEL